MSPLSSKIKQRQASNSIATRFKNPRPINKLSQSIAYGSKDFEEISMGSLVSERQELATINENQLLRNTSSILEANKAPILRDSASFVQSKPQKKHYLNPSIYQKTKKAAMNMVQSFSNFEDQIEQANKKNLAMIDEEPTLVHKFSINREKASIVKSHRNDVARVNLMKTMVTVPKQMERLEQQSTFDGNRKSINSKVQINIATRAIVSPRKVKLPTESATAHKLSASNLRKSRVTRQ